MEEWERLVDIPKGITVVSPAGKVDEKLIKISGFFELESMKNVEVLIFDRITSSTEKLPIQIMFEDNIISTYFPGREVPDRFVSKNVGPMISFTVTLSPYGYSRGLDLCLVYSLPADIDFLRRRPLEVEIRIPSRGIERFYRPRCHGIPGTGEDMVWLIHWIVGDLFKEGDVVLVTFRIDIALSGKIKECGVSLMPCPKVDAVQWWGTLRQLLISNEFQVLPWQDGYREKKRIWKKTKTELVKVYTPYKTSYAETSDTLGFGIHRETPKVSHGKNSRLLINISGFMEWDRMKNVDVLIVDSITSSRKELPIQILFEHGIISTYFTGREVPDRFVSKNVGSMISFTVKLSPSGYYRGLDLCLVYTLPDDMFFSQIPLHVEMYIRSSGKKRFYTPRYYGIPGTGGDMVWQMHWLEEDLFKEGDEVLVMFYIHPEGQIKECGVHIWPCAKNTVPTYWGALRTILRSNEFQVLPTPVHELVKAYMPDETLYTRKSYTDSLSLPIWETPKVSPVGKVDEKLINISGFFELDSMKNVEVLIVDCIMSTRKKLPIQIIFEHDIISTYFPGREVPDRFVSKNFGSMISFTVTLSHYGYCRGLDLCLVYSLPADRAVFGRIPPLQVEISIPSRGIRMYYRPRCYGIPGTGEDMVWLIHWVEGDLFKEGDVVVVEFETDGKIKDCGVSLLSCPKFEALQYWRTLKKSLESNAFQVLPLPDRKSKEAEDSEHFDRGSTSGTAPERGVLSMEELVVTERQDLFPEESSTKLTEDLSGTNMYTLPHYIFRLVALQKLILRSCAILMMELPREIGDLMNLEVLDLEGTEILCLPKEIANLDKLTCLKVSFDGYANQKVIQRGVLSDLSRLKELIIDVTPYGEWWDVEVEAILDDLRNLKELTTLKLYLPTFELLKYVTSIFPSLANFRFTVGRQEEHFISRLPRDVEEEFNNWEKLEKGLKFINGDCIPNEITKVLKQADAFFLQHHWTAESLSQFGHKNLNEVKFFLVMECNEFRTIIDSEKLYQGKDGSTESEDFPGFDEAMVLGPLERLIIRYMKNMESIWKGPVGKRSLSNLKSLALHTCPNLTTLFTIDMLSNLMNLEELIVEDCQKINSLVSFKDSGSESVPFLPSLKKISLLWLPGLVSISSGLEIALKLERMVIYYCPKLEKLSTAEVSSKELKVIKGEKEWWDSLKWYESDVSTELENYLARLFIPLRRDGDLMAQLTEDEIAASGQGKVGSFKRLDCLSNFSKEELLEEIPSEELEEISSEEVGGFKILGTSTATTSTTINFRTELDSYEAACRLDRDLQTFDTTLQARTNQVITSLATGVEVRHMESLLEMNQEVVKVILECRQDIWNTPELYELVEEYFDNSLQTLDFCTALEKCLNRARDSQLLFLVALEVLDEESGLEGGKGYVETLEELKKFKAAGDPFADEFIKIFHDVYSHQTSMLDKLQTKKKKLDNKLKKKKLDKKLKTTQAWRRVSGIIFATTVAEVLICSVMATAIAAPPVAAALAAASAVPPGSMGTWIDSLWRKYEDAVKGQKDVVRSREMGTRIVIKDLDNIQLVIDRLEIKIESLLSNVDFVIEEKAVKIGIEEIKKKVEVFLKNVEDLRVQTDMCIRDVQRARTVVFQRLIRPPNP